MHTRQALYQLNCSPRLSKTLYRVKQKHPWSYCKLDWFSRFLPGKVVLVVVGAMMAVTQRQRSKAYRTPTAWLLLLFVFNQRSFWKKNQQGLHPRRTRIVGDEGIMGDFQGACWEGQQPNCLSLADKPGLGGAGDKPSSALDGVFQDRRNGCLLDICLLWIFIFAVQRLQEGLV